LVPSQKTDTPVIGGSMKKRSHLRYDLYTL
jgi:hypothetical protein